MTFEIQKIDHVVLRVSNVERAVRFYMEVLGCTLERRVDDLGLTQLRAGSGLIDLVGIDGVIGKRGGVAPGKTGKNLDHLALQIAPFDGPEILKHLENYNVSHSKIEMRYGADGHGLSIYIEDPDGNTVELKGASEEDVGA